MNRHIDYYLWMNSDWAYLGADRLKDLVEKHNLELRFKPVDLPEVYIRTGGILLNERAPERQAYRITELKRWCKKLGIHVNPTPAYMCPNADLASCIVIAANCQGLEVHELYKAILRAEWCEERDISCIETLLKILNEQCLDGEELLEAAQQVKVLDLYKSYTEEAIKAGVFGSPSYVFNGELFWGQDRLEMLEEAVIAVKEFSVQNSKEVLIQN